jgi:PAS domain S-box-containing protein
MLHGWLEKTSIPLYAGKPDGEILWCNTAFESLTGYTQYELLNGRRDWNELTSCPEDKEADSESLSQVMLGLRESYRINKSIRAKDGIEINVISHTVRYPNTGELEVLLCSLQPLNAGSRYQTETISDVHRLLIEMATRDRLTLMDRLWNWAIENQWKAGLIGCVALAFFLGEDFLYALRSVLEVFRGMPSPPVD